MRGIERSSHTSSFGRASTERCEVLLCVVPKIGANEGSTRTVVSNRNTTHRGGAPTVTAVGLQLVAEFFPRGISQYAVGGVMVATGIAVIYLGTAIIPGNSTFLETTLSYVSDLPRFNRPKYLASRDWRVVFAVSIVAGAALWGLVLDPGPFLTEVQPWRLFFGGILVGVGTRIGKGCTAGHGVCGLGSASRTSLVNVALFVGVAIVTAAVFTAMGVAP